jgi:hypothetical protein
MALRTLLVDGLVNGRDLGGLPRLLGGVTPGGVFYRSETVDRITVAGWDQVYQAGIRSIVDLRAPGEVERDIQSRPAWLTTVVVDLDDPANRDFWPYYEDSGLDGTPVVFLPHLAAMPERMRAVLTALARAPAGGVLFHCMSGRDRTGLTAMVLLSIAGVEPDAIVDDFLKTARLGDVFALTTNAGYEPIPIEDLLREHGTTTERALREALAGLRVDRLNLAPDVLESLSTWRGQLSNS